LEHELKVMIIEQLKVEDVQPEELKDDDPLFGEGLGLDSLDAVELVLLLKKHYHVEIKDMEEAREPFTSISSLAKHVRKCRPDA
jgi:acyl carrier protein